MERPGTTHSCQELHPCRPILANEILLNFYGMVIGSIGMFRVQIHMETAADQQFYRTYLDDFEVWSLDLSARLQATLQLDHDGMCIA